MGLDFVIEKGYLIGEKLMIKLELIKAVEMIKTGSVAGEKRYSLKIDGVITVVEGNYGRVRSHYEFITDHLLKDLN